MCVVVLQCRMSSWSLAAFLLVLGIKLDTQNNGVKKRSSLSQVHFQDFNFCTPAHLMRS